MRLAPSILAADLADLTTALRVCEEGGADLVHVDVMDGHFVPNLTFGIPVLRDLGRHTDLPMDVHLMVDRPGELLGDYLAAGAHRVAVHWEATTHLDRLLNQIRDAGAAAGVALNPATPIDSIVDVLPTLDFVLMMSVNPGFAGQPFLPYVLDKTRRLRQIAADRGLPLEIELDGGVGLGNLVEVLQAGVDTCVAGSAIFGTEDPVATMKEIKRLASQAVEEQAVEGADG